MTYRHIAFDSGVSLVWLGKDGCVRQWFFHSRKDVLSIAHKSTIFETFQGVRKVPYEQRRSMRLAYERLNIQDYEYLNTIFASPLVFEISSGKDNKRTPVIVKDITTNRTNITKNYTFKCEISYPEERVLNV